MKKNLFLLVVVLVGLLLCPFVSAEIVLTDDNVDSYVGKSIIDTDAVVDIDSKRLNKKPYEVFNYKASGGCVNYVCARHWEKLKITYGVNGSTGNGRDCASRHIDGKKMTSIQTGITYTIRTYFNDAGANIKANSWVSFETSSKGYEKFGHVVFVEYVKIDENGIKQIYYTENVNAGVLKKATLEKFVGGSLSSWATTYLGTACYEIDDSNNISNSLSPVYNGTYNIVSALNGEKSAVGVSGDSKNSKANVHLWTRHTGDSQKWELKKSGNYYTITNVRSGKALDVYDASTKSGANVWQYDVNGTKAQQWSIEDAGNGYVYIKSALGNYLDVSDGKSANGTNIQTYKGNGTNSQKFRLVPICLHSYSQKITKAATCTTNGTKTYTCTKCNNNYAETIPAVGHSYSTNSYGNGVGIEYTCTKCGDNYVSAVIDEGTYSIRTAVVTERSIDVNDQSLENKANIHIWDVGNQNSQKWKIEKQGKYYTIVNVNSGKALDAAGGDTGYGVSVYQYEPNKSDSQLWEFILRNDGYYIKSKLGRYLTRVGINNGGRVALYDLNNPQYRIEQLWKLVQITPNEESKNIENKTSSTMTETTTSSKNEKSESVITESAHETANLTITFDPMGGKVSPISKKGEFNTPYGSLPTPTRNGYVFLGWYTVKGGGGNEVTSTHYVMKNYDHTLYAHWEVLDDQTCIITYNANGGIEPPSPQTVNEGECVTISNEKLSRSGYEFLGWSKKASSNKADYTPGQKVTINEDITLYAVWKAKDESFVLTIGDTKANVFGQIKYNDVAPIIENNRTMLPARFIAENLGADVEWIDKTRCVLITKEDTEIEIFIGNEYAKVNGKKHKLDSPAFIRDNRTYTPVRFICENLGADVEWNSKERSVKITLVKCSVCGSTNHTEHIESDGWEESLPSFVKNNQDDYIIEKRTEYLYETRETRESDKEYISGWDLYDTDVDESSWSKWQETPVYKSSTREVRTKTQYGYYHYALYFNNVDFGTYPVDLEFYNNTELSDASREEYHEVWLDSELKENGKVTYYNKVTKERVTKMGYKNTHCSPTKMNNLYYLGERTVYQYKDTSYTYYHEKWTEGEWTSKKKSENSNCRLIDTRTVYKYESR